MNITRCHGEGLKICESCGRNVDNNPPPVQPPPFKPDVREGGRCMDWVTDWKAEAQR